MHIDLFRVVSKPGNSLNPNSDEWGNIEIAGEALTEQPRQVWPWTMRAQVVNP